MAIREAPTFLTPAVWLTGPEKRALKSIAKGHPVSFAAGARPATRTLRASFLRLLLTEGGPAGWPPAYPRLVIENAIITEPLSLAHVRRRTARDAALASFEAIACIFEHAPNFCDARIEGLLFRKCRMPGLSAERIEALGDIGFEACSIRGDMKLTRARITGILNATGANVRGSMDLSRLEAHEVQLIDTAVRGVVDLKMCRIEANVWMNGARLGHRKKRTAALNLNSGRIGGDLFLKSSKCADTGRIRRFVAHGMVHAIGASVRGGVEIHDAQLSRGVEDYALDFARLETDGCLFLRTRLKHRLEVDGCIDLSGARIGGYARICGADLSPTIGGVANGICLDLTGTRINGVLEMADLTRPPDETRGHGRDRPEGWYKFASAHVGTLVDHPNSAWPRRGLLELTNFTYDLIRLHYEERGRPQRVDWPMLQYSEPPRPEEFSPQPFERLAAVLRTMGFGQEADEVAVRKRKMRIDCGVDRPLNRLLAQFMYVTSRHGYAPSRAVAWTIAYWLVGAALLTIALLNGWATMKPDGDDPAQAVTLVFWLGKTFTLGTYARGCSDIAPPLYALDMLIPGLRLGQVDACVLEARGLRGGLFNTVRTIYQVGGLIMTAVLVSTLTGILRRD